VRVLIADDYQIVRKGICAILAARPDIEVCGEAENGQEAVDKVRGSNPDLVILDITMPKLDGFAAAREIRKYLPRVPILLVSMHESNQFLNTAKSIGVKGYVVKTQASAVLLDAVDAVLRGEEFFPLLSGTASERQATSRSRVSDSRSA